MRKAIRTPQRRTIQLGDVNTSFQTPGQHGEHNVSKNLFGSPEPNDTSYQSTDYTVSSTDSSYYEGTNNSFSYGQSTNLPTTYPDIKPKISIYKDEDTKSKTQGSTGQTNFATTQNGFSSTQNYLNSLGYKGTSNLTQDTPKPTTGYSSSQSTFTINPQLLAKYGLSSNILSGTQNTVGSYGTTGSQPVLTPKIGTTGSLGGGTYGLSNPTGLPQATTQSTLGSNGLSNNYLKPSSGTSQSMGSQTSFSGSTQTAFGTTPNSFGSQQSQTAFGGSSFSGSNSFGTQNSVSGTKPTSFGSSQTNFGSSQSTFQTTQTNLGFGTQNSVSQSGFSQTNFGSSQFSSQPTEKKEQNLINTFGRSQFNTQQSFNTNSNFSDSKTSIGTSNSGYLNNGTSNTFGSSSFGQNENKQPLNNTGTNSFGSQNSIGNNSNFQSTQPSFGNSNNTFSQNTQPTQGSSTSQVSFGSSNSNPISGSNQISMESKTPSPTNSNLNTQPTFGSQNFQFSQQGSEQKITFGSENKTSGNQFSSQTSQTSFGMNGNNSQTGTEKKESTPSFGSSQISFGTKENKTPQNENQNIRQPFVPISDPLLSPIKSKVQPQEEPKTPSNSNNNQNSKIPMNQNHYQLEKDLPPQTPDLIKKYKKNPYGNDPILNQEKKEKIEEYVPKKSYIPHIIKVQPKIKGNLFIETKDSTVKLIKSKRETEIKNMNIPKLTKEGYYTIPALESLDNDELMNVKNFTICRKNIGRIQFPGYTNIQRLNLDEIVNIEKGKVTLYPDEKLKPKRGLELNKQVIVTMLNIRSNRLTEDEFIQKLKDYKYGKFVHYDKESCEWIYSM